MTCCLNPNCSNPQNSDQTNSCPACSEPLVLLRNHYRPIKHLGNGSFGRTYLAEDTDNLNKYCVIKQFAPQIQGTNALRKAKEYFEQEAQKLKNLGEHPQIPTLLAYFDENNILYLIQQYIEGETLDSELKSQGVFNEQKLLDFLKDFLEILKFVHEHNVIHRDIKPENIIRRKNDHKIFLIDFGIAKESTMTAMGQKGTQTGTFGYVASEQMDGGTAYHASDLYSLGATCFFLLTGINPWDLWKTKGYSWVESWQQHLKQPLTDDQLKGIIDKLLKENYQDRYQSAAEVLTELNPLKIISEQQPSIPVSPNWKKYTLILLPILGVGGILGGIWLGSKSYFDANPISVVQSYFSLKTTLNGHLLSVNSISMSPDGQSLASGSKDKTIKIWDVATGMPKATLTGHSNTVNSVAFSPNGQSLASGSDDNTIRIWDVSKIWDVGQGTLKVTINGHSDTVTSVVFSPDGKSLASASADSTIKIWDVTTGKPKNTLNGHSDTVWSVVFSPDGQNLASASADRTVKIWDVATGKPKNTFSGHSNTVNSVAFSPDGKSLASASHDRTVKIWDVATGKPKNTFSGYSDYTFTGSRAYSNYVRTVVFSPDGQSIAAGSRDHAIKIWNVTTGDLKNTFTLHSAGVISLVFSPDGRSLASSGYNKSIKIWRISK